LYGDGKLTEIVALANQDYLIMVNRWTPGFQSFSLNVPDCNTDPELACLACVPLATEINLFTGRAYIGYNEINWESGIENNLAYYSLQKQVNETWQEIARKPNGGANSLYIVADPKPIQGQNYYRLQATHTDGTTQILDKVISVESLSGMARFSIYYDNTQGSLFLNLPPGRYTEPLMIYDIFGKKISEYRLPAENDRNISIQYVMQELNAGIYFAKIGTQSLKFLKH